jgi:hypothetical protein
LVNATVEAYSKEEGNPLLKYEKNDNGSCSMINTQNRKKFVLMFAQFADEFKVGFAYYEPDEYGAVKEPEWVEDIFNYEFDEVYLRRLISEHLI